MGLEEDGCLVERLQDIIHAHHSGGAIDTLRRIRPELVRALPLEAEADAVHLDLETGAKLRRHFDRV